MGWASTDNALSLGLSARKFIILSNSAAQPSRRARGRVRKLSGNRVLRALTRHPRGWRACALQGGAVFLPSFPASLPGSRSRGTAPARYKFYLSSAQERREEAVSRLRAAGPRGHQLKALIGQQCIKVVPGSGSSERQESISWAFVSKHRNTEEDKKKKGKKIINATSKLPGGRARWAAWTPQPSPGASRSGLWLQAPRIERPFPRLCSEPTSLRSPKRAAWKGSVSPGPAPRARVDAAHICS